MANTSKGKSPFYPGQPVPAELFVGRPDQLQRILTRGAGQVAAGKPVAMFVQGEYGIGKSSLAGFVQRAAEMQHHLHPVYVPLGGAEALTDLAAAVLESTVRSGALDPTKKEKLRNWLAQYLGEQSLYGISINFDALKKDAPKFSKASGMLDFIGETFSRLQDTGVKGIFLVLDEINGITANSQFAHFIKGLVDQNALSKPQIPLLLMLCGVEEKRREMISKHQPIERIFDVVEIPVMTKGEMRAFFSTAFASVNMEVEPGALDVLIHLSAGFPKIMHLIGDAAYWQDEDGVIDRKDAWDAVFAAADDVGKRYVDPQVYKALRSKDYHSILKKIGQIDPLQMTFTKKEVAEGLSDSEKMKFNNFLQRMKKLHVLRSGDQTGEYVFNMRMVRLYIWLESQRKKPS